MRSDSCPTRRHPAMAGPHSGWFPYCSRASNRVRKATLYHSLRACDGSGCRGRTWMPRRSPAILMPIPSRNVRTQNNLPCGVDPPQRLSHARMRSAVPRLEAAASSVFLLQPTEAPALQKADEGEMNVLRETKPRLQGAANVYLAVDFPAPLSPHPVRILLTGISFQARRR